jgi:hypothetical protein
MSEQLVVELLAVHADRLSSPTSAVEIVDADLSADEQDELASLVQLAEQLKCSMPRVRPSPAFVHTLGEELVASASAQSTRDEHKRRSVLIGAAAVGSVVSIASIVGAIVYFVSRTRNQSHAHAPSG